MTKGERVAVSLGNNWEFAVTTYALFKLGAILVRIFDSLVGPETNLSTIGAIESSLQLSASDICPHSLGDRSFDYWDGDESTL